MNAQCHREGPARPASQGFTLLELMVTVAILALLLGIGIPSFNAMMRQNRLAGQTNELVGATAMARSEAVKRGSMVTLCAATDDQSECSGTDDWTLGWIVFSDLDGDGVIDGGAQPDEVVQRWGGSAAQRIAIDNPGVDFISYRGDGSASIEPGMEVDFLLWSQPCEPQLGARQVRINAAGRTSSVRVACP